jgi:hypothetical protein
LRLDLGESARCCWITPQDVTIDVGAGVDTTDFAKYRDVAIFATGNRLVSDAEEHIAGEASIRHHWRYFDSPTVADSTCESNGGALGDGGGVAVVAAQQHRLLADVVADAAFAEFKSAFVGVPGNLTISNRINNSSQVKLNCLKVGLLP